MSSKMKTVYPQTIEEARKDMLARERVRREALGDTTIERTRDEYLVYIRSVRRIRENDN